MGRIGGEGCEATVAAVPSRDRVVRTWAGAARRPLMAAIFLALSVGFVAHRVHVGAHADHSGSWFAGFEHWGRDSLIAIPLSGLVIAGVNFATRGLWSRGFASRLHWALLVGLGYSIALVPGGIGHGRLDSENQKSDGRGQETCFDY